MGGHARAVLLARVAGVLPYCVNADVRVLFFGVARWRADLTAVRASMLGALAGAAALMRWQDAIFILVPLIEVARSPRAWSSRAASAAAIVASWLVVFSPQMVVWFVLYGRPFTMPQGPSFMQWTSPHPMAVLFSDNHGLFTWAPLLALSVIGLIDYIRRHPTTALPISVVVVVSWYMNAAVADWWAGEAFGARRFLSLFPFSCSGWPSGSMASHARRALRWRVALSSSRCSSGRICCSCYSTNSPSKAWRQSRRIRTGRSTCGWPDSRAVPAPAWWAGNDRISSRDIPSSKTCQTNDAGRWLFGLRSASTS